MLHVNFDFTINEEKTYNKIKLVFFICETRYLFYLGLIRLKI